MRWQACEKCKDGVRVDDGSYLTTHGVKCDHLDGGVRRSVESTTVIFRSKDGRISIPWEPNAKCPRGFIREEVKGVRAVRRLEKELDDIDLQKWRKHQAAHERVFGPAERERAEGLKQIISQGVAVVPDGNGGTRTIHVSPWGRELARHALERGHNKGMGKEFSADNHRE